MLVPLKNVPLSESGVVKNYYNIFKVIIIILNKHF